jgi:hypothetical protein
MDFDQAERHFRRLQSQRDRGELDPNDFRVEVAKLMFRDGQGTFWMLDAETGAWFCNQGESWQPGDPRAVQAATPTDPALGARRRWRRLALGITVLALLGLVGAMLLFQWPIPLPNPFQPTPAASIQVDVAIASPADGSQVALDQEVAVESTLQAASGLQAADRVELQVNGQTVDAQPVRSRIQPDQVSLPLSQSWRPGATGEYQVAVLVLPAEGEPLGQATITLYVEAAPGETLPEPACMPNAAFIADVTIPPGTAFRPATQMEKVWQVRNSGSCAWGVGYELVRTQAGALDAPDKVPIPPTAAGESADLAVTFQAPSAAGAYSDTWQLRSPDGTTFGPALVLSIEVETQAQESRTPNAPTGLEAKVTEDGKAVRLTWQDQSDDEDAFRVYREDVEASIGLAPANAQFFLDSAVSCGSTYRYGIAAFNAAGSSPFSETAEVSLSPCAPSDAPPTLVLSVVPTQAVSSETINLVFQATDDVGVTKVTIWGEDTGVAELDAGRSLDCTGAVCSGSWPISRTVETTTTLTILALAIDSSAQESEPTRVQVIVLPEE